MRYNISNRYNIRKTHTAWVNFDKLTRSRVTKLTIKSGRTQRYNHKMITGRVTTVPSKDTFDDTRSQTYVTVIKHTYTVIARTRVPRTFDSSCVFVNHSSYFHLCSVSWTCFQSSTTISREIRVFWILDTIIAIFFTRATRTGKLTNDRWHDRPKHNRNVTRVPFKREILQYF